MFLFAAAFFGGLLLVPTYFQQVRGETTLQAGLLVAPQGIGAMLTMPIAGMLTDKMPVGRIVPFGLLLIVLSMFGLTQIQADTPYPQLIALLFVMGLGMGGTMMPVMTSALKTLTHHEVARGSTLLNITQQIASSVGVAIMSVVLTNNLASSPVIPGTEKVPGTNGGITETQAGILSNTRPAIVEALHIPANIITAGLDQAAQAFASTYWVAWALVVLTLVPALMLPRKREVSHLEDDEEALPTATLIH
jgi:MFS family permease